MRIKININRLPLIDFILSIIYIFFANYFSNISHSGLIDTILKSLKYISLGMFALALINAILCDFNKGTFILTYVSVSLIIIGITYFFHGEVAQYFGDTVISYLGISMRMALLLYIIDEYELLLKAITWYSVFVSAFLFLQFFVVGISYNNGRYSMGLGYISLLPALILIFAFFEKRKIVFLISVVILIGIMLIYASRGPILCVLLCAALLVLRKSKPFVIISALCLALLCFIFISDILQFISGLVPNGVQSRTLQYFLSGQATNDSGRSKLYTKIINEILAHPFSIRGINSDFLLIGVYTHNIFLELLYEFGILIGGFLSLSIIYKTIKTYINMNGLLENDVCFIFMICSIPQLLMSHTLWTEWTFWAWLILYYKLYSPFTRRVRNEIKENGAEF